MMNVCYNCGEYRVDKEIDRVAQWIDGNVEGEMA